VSRDLTVQRHLQHSTYAPFGQHSSPAACQACAHCAASVLAAVLLAGTTRTALHMMPDIQV